MVVSKLLSSIWKNFLTDSKTGEEWRSPMKHLELTSLWQILWIKRPWTNLWYCLHKTPNPMTALKEASFRRTVLQIQSFSDLASASHGFAEFPMSWMSWMHVPWQERKNLYTVMLLNCNTGRYIPPSIYRHQTPWRNSSLAFGGSGGVAQCNRNLGNHLHRSVRKTMAGHRGGTRL